MCSHWHVILHLHAKFRSNQTNDGEVLTSYRFFKMAAIESEIFYFRVQVWWLHSFMKVEIYLHTKFRLNISIYGWDKTTSGFGKRMAAIMEFYFWFPCWHMCSHRYVTMLDHPRSAIAGLSLTLKFGLDPIYSFGDIVIFIFCRFGLKLPIHAFFGGRVRAYSPKMVTHSSNPQKTILVWKHVVWAIKRENRSTASIWAQDREKR